MDNLHLISSREQPHQTPPVDQPTTSPDTNAVVPATPAAPGGFDISKLPQLQQALQQLALSNKAPAAAPDPTSASHKFWRTQPIIHDNADPNEVGPVEIKTLEDVRATPYPLPKGFEWDTLDLNDEKQLDEMYNLLYLNYVEDDDCHFRFHYSKDFLRWALMPPGYLRDWHLVVRRTGIEGSPIIGLITAIPSKLVANEQTIDAVEVNFLCVHKDLRSKRIAPQLIKEITRRVNLQNVWQATYTGGSLLPRPVSQAQYFHRSLNPKKLIDIGFSGKPRDVTILQLKKKYALPSEPQQKGFIPMEQCHVESATALLLAFQQQKGAQLYQKFSPEDLGHFLLPRKDIIETYVKVDENGAVTDFYSYYLLPSSVFGVKNYDTLNVAYAFYNVATTVTFNELINEALISSKQHNADVYNMLHLLGNETCFKDLLFTPGDGTLYYYMYNWKSPQFPDDKLGLVMF